MFSFLISTDMETNEEIHGDRHILNRKSNMNTDTQTDMNTHTQTDMNTDTETDMDTDAHGYRHTDRREH